MRPSRVDIDFCNLRGGMLSCWTDRNCFLDWGSAIIDLPSGFVDRFSRDLHLTYGSPCREAGNSLAPNKPFDFEGDPREALNFVDIGADEYYPRLFHRGVVVPGTNVTIHVVGYPQSPVTLFLGSKQADPPVPNRYGDFYLDWPPIWWGKIGKAPKNGVLRFPIAIPVAWIPGSEYPIQALVGPRIGPSTWLTNCEVLRVE